MKSSLLVSLLPLVMGCAAMKQKLLEEAVVDIWEHGNLARIDEAYEPELAHEIKRFVTENRDLYPDIDVTIDDVIIKGNRYVTTWTVTGTHKDIGRAVALRGVSVRTRTAGKIVQETMFYDVKAIYDQLGFTVTPPEALGPYGKVEVSREPAPAVEPAPAPAVEPPPIAPPAAPTPGEGESEPT